MPELNNTYTLSFLGGLTVGDTSNSDDNNNPNINRLLEDTEGPVWNKTAAYKIQRQLENTSTNSEFHSNIQQGKGVDQECIVNVDSNKLECSINFGDSIVTNGSFRLDLINIGVTSMTGVEFYGRDDLREKYKTTKRSDMNLP